MTLQCQVRTLLRPEKLHNHKTSTKNNVNDTHRSIKTDRKTLNFRMVFGFEIF